MQLIQAHLHNDAVVCVKIEDNTRVKSVESTIFFSHYKDGRGSFQSLIARHAGEMTHLSISTERLYLLQYVKCNFQDYPPDIHVSNPRQDRDDLIEWCAHVQFSISGPDKRVGYLIESMQCTCRTLQAATGLIIANTKNMREDFGAASSSLIGVDPFHQSSCSAGWNADVSSIYFKSGSKSPGVCLRWHPIEDLPKLSKEQIDDLSYCLRTDEDKKHKMLNFKLIKSNKGRNQKRKTHNKSGGRNCKSKSRKAIKIDKGLKSIMSMVDNEDQTNKALILVIFVSNS